MADANIRAVITAEDKASSTLKKVGTQIEGVGNSATKFLGDAMGQATMVATAGLAALTGAAVLSVKAFEESEAGIAQTNAVLASTKGVAGVAAIEITKLATALQKTTKYSDEDVRSVENLLLTFTSIGKDIFPQATKTVLNMATALGEDTKSASIQLGKALQDPILGITALRRVGVNFTDAQKDVIQKLVDTGKSAEAQKLILKELETEFGGSAEAAGNTFAGSLAKLNNALNDVEEGIGYMISQALIPLVQKFSELVAAVDWEQVMGVIGDAVTVAADKFRLFVAPIADFLNTHKQILLDFLSKFAETGLVIIPILAGLALGWTVLSSPLFLIITALTIGWELWEKHRVLFLALTVVLAPITLAFVALRAAMMFSEVVGALNVAIIALTGTDIAATVAANGLAYALGATLAVAAAPIVLVVVGVAAIWGAVNALNALRAAEDSANSAANSADQTYNSNLKIWRQQYAEGKISKARLDQLTAMGSGGVSVPSGSFATGGFTGLGSPGDIAGLVHKGEYVLPAPMVDQSTGLPKTSNPSVINVTVQAGAFMGNPSDARRYAQMIVDAMHDIAGAKNQTPAQMLGA